jgi:hypothetical protein
MDFTHSTRCQLVNLAQKGPGTCFSLAYVRNTCEQIAIRSEIRATTGVLSLSIGTDKLGQGAVNRVLNSVSGVRLKNISKVYNFDMG